MKSKLVVGVALLGATLAYAGPGDISRPVADLEVTEAKLLDDVRCDNCQTKESAIFDLGELQSEKAVIPLMDVLHSDPEESSRVVAALALCLIGDARGTYAVKRAATFDRSEKVRTRAAWFYNTYVREGSFQFEPAAGASMASKN
ncbi:MAG TPA: HEAT repeat domain-containing protein [Bacteroidota bacterium]|nr:HEAT repeat domain-containing protein [Bacteroidota bacterium]